MLGIWRAAAFSLMLVMVARSRASATCALGLEQIAELEKAPALSFDALMGVDAIRATSHSGLSTSSKEN